MNRLSINKYLKNDKYFLLFVMVFSLLVRLYYICSISVFDMQHDVGTPDTYYGHLGYISYYMQNFHLPDFDVREAFQFWHPPLHHWISAAFLAIIWKVFPDMHGNYEPLQLLPLLYITLCIWIVWKLLNLWNFKGASLYLPFLIIAFHPTFIILSGSVNNDALCFLFTILSIYLSLLWYRSPSIKLIIACALSIGLGMSSKGTAAIAAFPMAFIFLVGLFKYKMKVFGQLILFGIISLPLGMWWYIRNYILFDVPINYIYRTSTDAIGYLGNVPTWKRVFDFDIRRFSFQNIYVQFEGRFTEVNPITALLKSAVYGQSWFNYNIYIRIVAYPLVFIWTVFTTLSLYALPGLLKKSKEFLISNISIIILFVVQFISYYTFCIEYPYVWTMDIRYALPILLCHCLWLSAFTHEHPTWEKVIKYFTYAFVVITLLVFFLFTFTFK